MKKSNNELAELASKKCPYCNSEDINLGRIGNPLFHGSGYTISSCNRCDSIWQLVYGSGGYDTLYLTEDNWNVNVCKFCGIEHGGYDERYMEEHGDFCEWSGENAIWVTKEEFTKNNHYKMVCPCCSEEHGEYCEDFDIKPDHLTKRWFPNERKK